MLSLKRHISTGILLVGGAVGVLLCGPGVAVSATAAQPAGEEALMPDLITGNLGATYLQWVAHGRKGPEPPTWTTEYLQRLKDAGVSSVEDYITFLPLEPERGHLDWHYYEMDYQRVHAAGMHYAVYPWLHFAPEWFVKSPDYVPYVCLEHNLPTYSTSIWAPGTVSLFDRFYGQLWQEFGDRISDIYIGMPSDYGEVGFPVGMSAWVVPQQHAHLGFWCGDRFARADFRARMQARYHDLEHLNKAWGTHVASWDAPEYPPLTPPQDGPAGPRRRWLDFVSWYADSETRFVGEAISAVRKHFPKTPLQVKMGYGGELVQYGIDISGVIKLAARDGVTVRSTHGSLPAFFYKRFETPALFYGARLLTEPPASVDRKSEVTRLFNDATNGSTEFMDYPDNIVGARDILKAYLPWVQGERAYDPVALLFSTTDLRLHKDEGEPPALFQGAESLRDISDYGLVDENLVQDGGLRDFKILVLFEGNWLEQATLDRIAAWVRAGGTLVLAAFGPIHNVEGDTRTYDDLTGGLVAHVGDASFFAPAGPAPPRMSLDMGPGDGAFLGSGWFGAEPGKVTFRWSQARASLRVPVDPGKDLDVTVFAGQTNHIPKPPHLFVNGQDVGEVRFANDAGTVRIPSALLQGHSIADLTLSCTTWRPSETIPGNPDTRNLGVWVSRFEVDQVGAPAGPASPSPGFRADIPALLRECSRRVGKGMVVLFPLDTSNRTYLQLIGHLIYDDGAPVQPRVDTTFDGVQASVLPDKILFLNPTDAQITKHVALTPAEFAGVPGPTPPARDITLILAPHSIQAIRRQDGAVLSPGPVVHGQALPAK